jgi:ATP-dependent helicase/nuclease subunit A
MKPIAKTNTPKMHNDHATRSAAINLNISCIVSAPAGSGKTEILVQRMLHALSKVSHSPEQVLAITFTRKAAAEMRQRILNALNHPQTALTETAKAANLVLQRDKKEQWQLQHHPWKLQIMTFDALYAQIIQNSQCSLQYLNFLGITDSPELLYRQSCEHLLSTYKNSKNLNQVLEHLDNNIEQFIYLCCKLLATREQWLPLLMQFQSQKLKKILEQSLEELTEEICGEILDHIDENCRHKLLGLLHYQQIQLQQNDGPNNPMDLPPEQWPKDFLSLFYLLKNISQLLLTQNGSWRKSLNKNHGFPSENLDKKNPTHLPMKQQLLNIIAELKNNDFPLSLLQRIQHWPLPFYDAKQWPIIEALCSLLPQLTACLTVISQHVGNTDYTARAQAALQILKENQGNNPVALHYFNQFEHILIDEFQDTSKLQFYCIEALVSQWTPVEKNRSIMLVGDPMQSIYRFRQAEVSLFTTAEKFGIANIALQSLRLSQNFRSQQNLVAWVNSCFAALMPKRANPALGAIPYQDSQASHPALSESVVAHSCHDNQLPILIETLQKTRKQYPKQSCAVLVRSRIHGYKLITLLKTHNISYQANGLDNLSNHPLVSDLLQLMLACIQPQNKSAWLSWMHSPLLGLSYQDCLLLCQNISDSSASLWTIFINPGEDCPNPIKRRLLYAKPYLEQAMENTFSKPIHQWLHELFYALGGNILSYHHDDAILNTFFERLQDWETHNPASNLDALFESLNHTSLETDNHPNAEKNQIQIMTIHKAKGLEFDHVFMPKIDASINSLNQQLLFWTEMFDNKGQPHIIFSPLPAEKSTSHLRSFIQNHELQKYELEHSRLFYVATTRAKSSLHLFYDQSSTSKPKRFSFLYYLNSLLESMPHSQIMVHPASHKEENSIQTPTLLKIQNDFYHKLPNPIQKESSKYATAVSTGNQKQLYGIIIHKIIEQIPYLKSNSTEETTVNLLSFADQCIKDSLTCSATQEILKTRTQHDIHILCHHPNAKKLFFEPHAFQKHEWTIQQSKPQQKTLILDYIFLDQQQRYWIIDFKSQQPPLEETEEDWHKHLLKMYQGQLNQYHNAVSKIFNQHPIKTGIYLTATGNIIEFNTCSTQDYLH